jgi:hypothetical protein
VSLRAEHVRLYGQDTTRSESGVNSQLTSELPEPAPHNHIRPRSRRSRSVENDAYLAFCVRIIRAAGRRIADGDVEDLPDLLALQAELDQAWQVAVDGLHGPLGFSWAEIAARVGTTRQNAQQRWGHASHHDDGN